MTQSPVLSAALLFLAIIPGFAEESIILDLGEPESIKRELHAFNSNLLMSTALQGINYSSPEFRKSLEDLRPGGLRFPGGTTANNYLWKEDSFAEQEDDKTKWAARQLALFRKIGRPYDLPGYAAICNEYGLTPVYVLNVYEETPESVVALFKKFDELGLDVKAIELGNEPYWDPRSLMNVWKYMDYCQPLAEAIRKHRPDIQIGACFGPVREGSTYAEKWNAPLAKQKWYDAVVYHEYYGGQGFAMEAGVELPLEAVLRPEAFVDEPIQHFDELLPEMPIWFTEWNIGAKGLDQWKNTGAELLFIGASMTRILEHRDRFDWSCFHQIFEAKFGTFFHDREAGIQTLPSYEFFRLFRGAWAGAESFRPVPSDAGDPIRAFATEGDDGLRFFLLNRSDETTLVSLPESTTGHGVLCIAVEPEKTLPISEKITTELPADGNEISLPAYSMTLVAAPSIIESATRTSLKESGNLFPVRPHLTLWYPPYARNPPRVAADGSYTVDLDKLTDKKTVVIKMDLSGASPKSGDRLAVTFQRQATNSIGLVAKVPDAEKPDGDWIQLLPKQENTRLEFTYHPEINQGEVSFLFSESALSKGGEMTLRDFRIVRLSE